MRLGRKTQITKELTRTERNRRNNIKRLTTSAVVALIVFICLTVIQSSILNQEEKGTVYQVIADIPSGTKLTDANIDTFLGLKEVQLSLIPADFITDREVMIDKFVNRDYKINDIITTDGLKDTEKNYEDTIEKPIELSFSTTGLDTAVSGGLREGDYVNIYGLRHIEKDTEGDNLIEVDEHFSFKHVYIAKAFDGSGVRITTPADAEGAEAVTATLFSIIIDEKDANIFNEMISNCDIRVVKLLYDEGGKYESSKSTSKSGEAPEQPQEQTQTEAKQSKNEEIQPGTTGTSDEFKELNAPPVVEEQTQPEANQTQTENEAPVDQTEQAQAEANQSQGEQSPTENGEQVEQSQEQSQDQTQEQPQ